MKKPGRIVCDPAGRDITDSRQPFFPLRLTRVYRHVSDRHNTKKQTPLPGMRGDESEHPAEDGLLLAPMLSRRARRAQSTGRAQA